MRPQTNTQTTSAAVRLAVVVFALFTFVAVNAISAVSAGPAIQNMPDDFTAHSAFDPVAMDCWTSETGPIHPHCQTTSFDTAVGSRFTVRVLPTLQSSVWCYAAVTCGPGPMNQRLLRPPRHFGASF